MELVVPDDGTVDEDDLSGISAALVLIPLSPKVPGLLPSMELTVPKLSELAKPKVALLYAATNVVPPKADSAALAGLIEALPTATAGDAVTLEALDWVTATLRNCGRVPP